MKIIKKGLALLLTAALVITMVPAASVFAAGGSSAAGGDAFSAIGIDTSVASRRLRCRQHRQPVRKIYD